MSNKITEMLDEIRGATPEDKLRAGVEAVIKADTEKAKAKADADAETKKNLLEKVKAVAEKIKNEKQAAAEVPETPETPEVPEVPDTEEEEDKTAEIDKLTKQMADMAKEIEALKKRKNYRTNPPIAEKVDEVDDFIKQNITKDFEVVI
jgi:hypothetical protein